jgi:cell wall assembly regulator SMI1
MESISFLWQQIETRLKTHTPDLWKDRRQLLSPGVSEEALQQAETVLGTTLPEDFKAFYRLYDGQGAEFLLAGAVGWGFCSLTHVIGFWQMYRDFVEDGTFADQDADVTVRGPIQPVFWHLKWIPFAQSFEGSHWCLDLAPAPGGKIGQVISWNNGDGPLEVLFPSFEALFALFLEDVEAGVYSDLQRRGSNQSFKIATQDASPIADIFELASEYASTRSFDDLYATYASVLQMQEATQEERSWAYYALIGLLLSQQEWQRGHDYFKLYTAETLHIPNQYWWHSELRRYGMLFSNYSSW